MQRESQSWPSAESIDLPPDRPFEYRTGWRTEPAATPGSCQRFHAPRPCLTVELLRGRLHVSEPWRESHRGVSDGSALTTPLPCGVAGF